MRRRAFAAVLLLLGLAVAACGGGAGEADGSADAATPGGSSAVAYPMTLKNAWGETSLERRPARVATVSTGDTAIALALGIVPVISPKAGDTPPEYVTRAMERLGVTELKTYDPADGTDYEAIAAESPDVILGVNAWAMDDDYAKLSPIAPIVTHADKSHVEGLPWRERLRTAARALGVPEKAEEYIEAVRAEVAKAAADNPGFKDKTYTYAVVHPQQITFMSYADQDPGLFEELGLRKSAHAAEFSAAKDGVSLENLDKLDADVLLIAYPFGDEGVISAAELERNKLFQSIPAVKDGRFAVLPWENGLASAIAYPDALSAPWAVEQLTPVLKKALAGR